MRNNPFNCFLRNEAHELGDGGGASAPAAEVVEKSETPEPAAEAVAPREPTRLEKISAAIRGKAEILAENADLKKQLAALTASLELGDGRIDALTQRVSELEQENGQLQQDFDAIDAALKATEAKVVSIDASAARQLAGMGVEAEKLPEAEKEGDTVEALIARMNATSDPDEKYELAARINKMESEN